MGARGGVDERWKPRARRPSGAMASVVAVLLVFSGAGSILGLMASAARMRQLEGLSGPVQVQGVAQATWVRVVALLGLPATLVLVVVFLVWFHRTYKYALERRGDKIGGAGVVTFMWLLPIVNLFACLGATGSIWDAGGTDPNGRERRGLLLAWWIAGAAAVAMTVLGIGVGLSKALSAFGDAMDAAQRGAEPAAVILEQSASDQRLTLILGLLGALFSATAAVSAAAFVLAATARLGGRSRIGARVAAAPDRAVAPAIIALVLGLAAVALIAGHARSGLP